MASNYSLVKSPQLSHNVRQVRKTAETMRFHNESSKQNLLRGWSVNVCTGPSGQTSLVWGRKCWASTVWNAPAPPNRGAEEERTKRVVAGPLAALKA